MPSYKKVVLPICLGLWVLLITNFSRASSAQEIVPQAIQSFPGQITVNTAAMSPTTSGNPNDGKCDLREALQAAFSQDNGSSGTFNECTAPGGPNTIVFSPDVAGQIITIAPGIDMLPMITKEITIVGPITLSGSGEPTTYPYPGNHDSRILQVASDGVLTLTGLTLMNGFTSGSGGAILSLSGSSTINLITVAVVNNVAMNDGGAIHTNGTLNILGSTFSGNRALGINPDGTDNGGTGYGGAIFMSGYSSLTTSLTNFSGNITDKGGGAIYASYAGISIADTNFAGNIAYGVDGNNSTGGGAIFNYGSNVEITRSPFTGNVTQNGYGGAIFQNMSAPDFIITDSSFNANVSGDLNSDGQGGAIYNYEVMRIKRTTFNANVALGDTARGGAIVNNKAAVLELTNVAFLANAVVDGTSAAGQGGAIANIDDPSPISSDSTVELRNVTFTENKAASGGAIYNDELVQMWNTIVNEGTVGSGTCAGTPPQDNGHNLQNPGTACGASITSDNPDLDTPGFNGGPIPSLISVGLKDGSPAIDAGDNTICTGPLVNNEDQRGKPRPNDGDGTGGAACDIGSFEAATAKPGFGSDPTNPGPLDLGNTMMGIPVTFTLTLKETGNLPLTIDATLSGADAADFTIDGLSSLVIPNGSPDVPMDLVCNPQTDTAGTRTATLNLVTNDPSKALVMFDLTCDVSPTPVPGFGSTPAQPGPLTFGEVFIGQSKTVSFTVRNIGTANLNLSNGAIAGSNAAEFGVVNLPAMLTPGQEDTTSVSCTPTTTGVKVAQFTFTTDDPDYATVSFNLVCEGLELPQPFLYVPGQVVDNGTLGSSGSFFMASTPDGNHLYVTDYTGDALGFFQRQTDGSLTHVATYTNDVGGVINLDGPMGVTLSPDGKNVYVASTFSDSVTYFTRDLASGLLTYQGAVKEGDGYSCFPTCGGSVNGLDGAYAVAVSADGNHVYISSSTDDAIVVLNRDTNNGALRGLFGVYFVQSYIDATELNGARGLALSPDGLHLYAVSYSNNGLVAFSRNGTDGRLTFVEARHDGDLYAINPPRFINGLANPSTIAISPDGSYIYVNGAGDDAVAMFKRNAVTGQTLYEGAIFNNQNGITGMDAPYGVSLSPDGKYLFVTGYVGDSLNVLFRQSSNGALSHVQTATQTGLDGAISALPTADGKNVYVTSYLNNKVVNYQKANPLPVINTLFPPSAAGGSGGFTLSIYGENFLPSSTVTWNGTARDVTFVSDTELQIPVFEADLPVDLAVTSAAVAVTNPQPGGGSAVATFVITQSNQNPVPALASLNPPGAPAGSAALTLSLSGVNFMATSQVYWNDVARPTTFVSETELQISLTAEDLQNPGPAAVKVTNPGPGGGDSNGLLFTIAEAGQNPIPQLSSISPWFTNARGASSVAVQVTITGQNFMPETMAQWNGADRPTVVVSDTELKVTLLSIDVAFGSTGSIRVVNPGPGGGTSNSLGFVVYPYAIYVPVVIR